MEDALDVGRGRAGGATGGGGGGIAPASAAPMAAPAPAPGRPGVEPWMEELWVESVYDKLARWRGGGCLPTRSVVA